MGAKKTEKRVCLGSNEKGMEKLQLKNEVFPLSVVLLQYDFRKRKNAPFFAVFFSDFFVGIYFVLKGRFFNTQRLNAHNTLPLGPLPPSLRLGGSEPWRAVWRNRVEALPTATMQA